MMRLFFIILTLLTTSYYLYSVQPERFSSASFDLEYDMKYIHDYKTPFFEFNGDLYLTGMIGTFSNELFRIDTLNNELHLVIDLYKYGSSDPFILTELGDKFIFVTNANDKIIPTRFWSSDGTEEGTEMLFEVEESEHYSELIDNFIIRNNKLYIKTTGVLQAERFWVTDGTKEGTINLTDEFESFHINKMYLSNDKIVFLESYHSESKIGVLDTSDKLSIIGTFNIGYYSEVLAADDFFYFNMCKNDQQITRELWISDGTKDGTKKIFTANDTEVCLLDEENAALYGNSLYFNILDEDENTTSGWITDGTEEGTVNIEVGFDSEKVYTIKIIDKAKEHIFLRTSSKTAARSLWFVDLKKNVLKNLIEKWSSYIPDNHIKVGDFLYFKNGNKFKDNQIWKSDGSLENTELYIDPAKIENNEIGTFYFKGSYSDSLLFYSAYFDNYVGLFSINLYYNQVEKLTEFERSSDIKVSHVGGVTFFINTIDDSEKLYYNYKNQVEQINLEEATNNKPYLGNYYYSLGNYIYFFADYEGDDLYELYRIINPASGISSVEDSENNQIYLYPNPTSHNITLEIEGIIDISIIDLNGNKVLSLIDFTGGEIDISSLATGFYSITDNSGRLIGKFIKSK